MKCALILLTLMFSAPAAVAEPAPVRGIWIAPTGFSTAAAADKTIAQCRRAGLNVLIPNVMSHGGLFYKSKHFKHRVFADGKFDPLAYLIEKAHAERMQVHPWFNVYYETARGGIPPVSSAWLCRDFDGRVIDGQIFMSPCLPGVNEYLLSVVKGVLAYDIDGIHLDYIRYAGTQYDYSDAARKRFSKQYGFDPINFIDHGELIVPGERFPVRLLRTDRSVSRTWENNYAEKMLDTAGVGFAQIREKPANVDALKSPGLLVLSDYYDVTPEMLASIRHYLDRGGNVLWVDAPTTTMSKSPELCALLGVKGTKWTPNRVVTMRPFGSHPLAKRVRGYEFETESNAAVELDGAEPVAKLGTGEPAVTVNRVGKGQVVLVNFHLGKCSSGAPFDLVRSIRDYLRALPPRGGEGGGGVLPVSLPDPMAGKRDKWTKWRADQVTQLVRWVHDAAKAKSPKIAVSSSGGPSAHEFYSCYRDGKRWLSEDLTQYSFPMNYTENPDDLRITLRYQIAATPKAAKDRVFPGLQIYSAKTVDGNRQTVAQDPQIVAAQLKVVREMGYAGFVLFCDSYLTDEIADVVREAR